MSDVSTDRNGTSDAEPRWLAAIDVLARVLAERAPTDAPVAAVQPASPQEGLALVENFIAIEDLAIRQAILDLVKTIAREAAR